ncbi:uncharacterized protein cp110 [Halichoeres trimaculatus]|uniref:uncharacterized protein cp110 n=1 Tax=Halichoeres trimaculatus TaxID=147232 RepID=UPI003D9E5A6F
MEDYSTFVQRLLSSLEKRGEEDNKPQSPSSLICFYGRPILPPLLSGEQREEMQGYRHAAKKAPVHRKFKTDSRMAYVQTILHSVQLRKTPTLEELLQESQISPQHHNTTTPVTHDHPKDDPLLSPASHREVKDGVSLPLFTSTSYSASLTTDVTPQLEGCLMDLHPSQHGPQPSPLNGVNHQSLGYATCTNVENTSGVSGGLDSDMESHNVETSEGAQSLGAFFLHTSNTIAKIPDIISYPPIDGEELERSGIESSFYDDFACVKGICCSEPQEDSVICESLQGEKSGSSEGSTGSTTVTTVLDPDKDQRPGRMEDQVCLSDNRSFSDNPQSSTTISVQHCPSAELNVQQDPTETQQTDLQEDEEEPLGEPHRLSLQALLKKSQEYRRRQRMLRNQAKNSKIQERTQEQPRMRAEEPSLSDKENDESLHKGSLSAERKTTKEMRSTFVPSGQTSPKKSWDSERTVEGELFGERTNCFIETLTGDGKTKGRSGDDEELTVRNNKLNISQEVTTESKKISALPQRHTMSTDTLSDQEEILCKAGSMDFPKGERKYQTIPTPSFCSSPVRCKNKSSIQDKDAVDRTGISKVVINNGLNQNLNHPIPSNVTPMDEDDFRSSQQIDQLQSNLSDLKILVSNLEYTMTENFRNQSPAEDRLTQSDEEKSKEADKDQWTLQRRQSSDKSVCEDTGSAPSISYTDDAPVTEQETSPEAVNLSELRLVKTLVTERGKEKCSGKDGLSKSNRHGALRKQQPTAKCLLSAAQRQRIPDMFRNIDTKAAAPPDTSSVLLDTSNQPVEKRNKANEECYNLSHSPSLNQSYDVDAPSGLWLLEGSGPDLGLRGCCVQEQQLTPESEGEGQSGVSRVKRRLLMHMSEETPQRKTEVGGGSGSVVRPNSSSPKAPLRWTEGFGSLRERQERLKEAHAAQIRALQEEHRRQQEELLQALAARFRLLQSVSFPCSLSGSRLGDTLTFTSLSQPSSTLSEHCRPLLLAVVKGFLTRRLLRTERVAQLVRTVRDTRQLLLALRLQSTSVGEFSSRQDLLLQERLALQLRAARYEVNNIFFSLSARERMQLISWDRELTRERELRRQSGNTGHPRGKSLLSAATQKSLERKRGLMMQKKAAGRHTRGETKTGHNAGSSPEQPLETKRGQFRANPRRVPRSTNSSRPR